MVLPVVSIVGIEGMEKTALAQLIYNDPSIENFFELRLWVCVSDEFDIKEITEKTIMSATGSKVHKLNMEQLQGMLRKEIGVKKYLLVLDDVWNEDREKWLKMKGLLSIGRIGSKNLVTTRSIMVAKIMCTVPPYVLRGLSEKRSSDLFEKMAFEPGQAQKIPSLVDIGKEIVQKCANVPLAIRTLGSSLYAQDKSKWLSLKNRSLANISFNNHNIMNILEVSYHHLGALLKNCFAYCAIFPKDYNFNKQMLINLWIAEGFIVPATSENQMIEELGEEYFLTLLQRGFLQDVKMDEWECIESCKMHDLMHDLAQQVAGMKCKAVNPDENLCQDNNIRHLSIAYRLNFQKIIRPSILNLKRSRTFLLPQQISDGSTFNKKTCQKLITSFNWLRVLDFHGLGLIKVPDSIGKLIHLRYLNLFLNPIKTLPDSITELHNIQTLNLCQCTNLLALPVKITKLLNLKSFDVSDCTLSKMPYGIGELNLLRNLRLFIATFEKSSESMNKPTYSAKLCDLKQLNNLRGKLCIVIICQSMIEATQEILTCKHGLTELEISFDRIYNSISGHLEAVLEGLKPHPNLKKLKVSGYNHPKLPSWMMKDSLLNTLPNLLKIHLFNWEYCQKTPNFSQLPLLKYLSLEYISSVEYIEMEIGKNEASSSIKSPSFFPSLETLKLKRMEKLKGLVQPPDQISFSFPKLSNLTIHNCSNLTSFPNCPYIEKLYLVKTCKSLSVVKMVTTSSSKLKELRIGNVDELLSISKHCLRQLSLLKIHDHELVSTDKLEQVFATLSSSLQSLHFRYCWSLKSIRNGLEHLASLEELHIVSTNLPLQDDDTGEMPWKAFKTSLRTLRLQGCNKLLRLPRGIQHLTNLRTLLINGNCELSELLEWIGSFSSLQYLKLSHCTKLTSLPEGFHQLTSLQELLIINCGPELTNRCRSPNGRDWPKIRHIPLVINYDDNL